MIDNHYNLQKLMTFYIKVMVITITLFAILMSAFRIVDIYVEKDQTLNEGINRSSSIVESQQNQVDNLTKNINQSQDRVANLEAFFRMDPEAYLDYSQSHSSSSYFYYLPNQVADFLRNSKATKVTLSLNQESESISMNPQNLSGSRISAKKVESKGLYYGTSLINDSTYQPYGSVIVNFSPERLNASLKQAHNSQGMQIFVVTSVGRIRYSYNSNLMPVAKRSLINNPKQGKSLIHSLENEYFVKTQKADNQDDIVALVPKFVVYRKIVLTILFFILLAAVVDTFLWWTLKYVFHNYTLHLESMTKAMEKVSGGDLKTRIPVPSEEGELNTLATGINDMLDAIDQYVLQIYQLELAQKDANMKALQSQINPHFLYNTLEYIRMYAINEGQTELADVVFSFASLLRNNISQESTVTLEKEFEFAEKYIYLYQMRFPDQLGYQFNLADDLKDLSVPKFIVQPLVENYFKHGIDLERFDNAIHIKARKKANTVIISVSDNGTPLSDEQLEKLNDKLSAQGSGLVKGDVSIGLMNVKARMTGAFGNDFEMKVMNNNFGGVTVTMQIILEG
ncbi:sensor histidine kinase [Companilactobacillus huachuanensis]|uniref:Sensor histidine kinase n=1 Tax=Companilactobacillus huachuanensis TaxID=2559914 RepID=A0ABW1RM26_9LACO|nr:sensor histidine kinase [Companilactobacillus huachuanensis]